MKYDVIVIGSGAAGLSAAIFLARAGVKTLIVGDQKQSQLPTAYEVQNYFGFPEGISGKKLIELGIKHARKYNADIIQVHASNVTKTSNGFKIKLENNEVHESNFIIICSGLLSHREFASSLKLKTYKKNLIKVNETNKTSVGNVYAAGNCCTPTRQIAKDAGDGCNAAVNIIKQIKNLDNYTDYGPLSKE